MRQYSHIRTQHILTPPIHIYIYTFTYIYRVYIMRQYNRIYVRHTSLPPHTCIYIYIFHLHTFTGGT